MVLHELDTFLHNTPLEFPILSLFHVFSKEELYVFLILNGCLGSYIIYKNGKENIRLTRLYIQLTNKLKRRI